MMTNINQTTALILSFGAFLALSIVLIRSKTLLFGFSFFSFINIALASLSGFIFSYIFSLNDSWITSAHLWVFAYSAVGLIAFAIGLFIAWKPLRVSDTCSVPGEPPIWVNPQLGWLLLSIGVIAYILRPVAFQIPTLRAVWSNYQELVKFGLLITLTYGIAKRHYRPFVLAFVVYILVVVIQATSSGHIELGGSFLIQLLLVGCFWKGLRTRSIILFVIGGALLLSLMVGWLNSRSIIRTGELDDQGGIIERSIEFAQRFSYANPLSLSAHQIQDKLRWRMDMSNILASQARHQPAIVPYQYGGTVFPDVFSAIIPRFLWPDKPIRLGGSAFVSKYSGLTWGEDTSVGLPYQFELYANGGAWAVVIGLFIIGWITGKLDLMLVMKELSLPKLLALMTVVNGLAKGSQTLNALVMQIIAGYIGAYVLGFLLQNLSNAQTFWPLKDGSAQNSNVFLNNYHQSYLMRTRQRDADV